MAYTLKQLSLAWSAVHDGITPDAATLATLQTYATQSQQGQLSDQQALSYIVNSADSSTALAVLAYQFFTGKSPSAAGLDYLVNSSTNPNDLNDAYYAKFGLENRYINFAANLGVQGEGAASFAAKYGAMSFGDYIAAIYETIIGATYAKAAGIDAAKAIADITSRQDAIKATAVSAGMITPNMTAAQIDLAVKAAAAGYLLGEAIKADVGLYAGAANNFMLALATGTATYNTDITKTYTPTAGSGSTGTGTAVSTAPSTPLPGADTPPVVVTPPAPLSLALTSGVDTLLGGSGDDTFSATDTTLQAGDTLNGASGRDVLNVIAATGGGYTAPTPNISNIETVTISNAAGLNVNTSNWLGVTQLNGVTSGGQQDLTAGNGTDVTATAANQGTAAITVNGGRNVTVNATGSTAGEINVLGAGGAVTVTRAIASSAVVGDITIIGAGNVDVTVTAPVPVNPADTQDTGAVYVQGSTATTSVKVKGVQSVASDGSHGALTGELVIIRDAHYGTALAGTLTKIAVDGYGDLAIGDSALTTLTASHGGDIAIGNADAVASPVKTLNATLNDIHGQISDLGVYTTLNVVHGAGASSIEFDMAGLRSLNIAGAGALEIIPNATVLANLQTLTVTGSTSISAFVDPSVTTLTAGSGADVISLTGSSQITKAISMGGGDDTVYLEGATSTITATVDGGAGTDTIWIDAVDAHDFTALYASKIINFERVHLSHGNAFTVDVAALGHYHYVATEGGAGMTLNGLSSGDTLELTDGGTSYTLGGANFGGANDSLNLVLSGLGAIAYATTGITAAGVETLNITASNPNVTNIKWLGNDLKSLVLTGNSPSIAVDASSTALTSFDASGLQNANLQWASGATTGLLTIKGSSTFSIIDASSALGGVHYIGVGGAEIVAVGIGANTIELSAGASHSHNVAVLAVDAHSATAFTTISGLHLGDHVQVVGLTGAMGSQITGQASLAAYMNTAAGGDGSTTPISHWFQFGSDTYIVIDNSASGGFADGVDLVVKLVGTFDLTHATESGGAFTL